MRIRFGSGSSAEALRRPVLFPLVFLGAGLWAVYQGVSRYRDGALLQDYGIFLAVGVIFGGSALRQIRRAVSARKNAELVEVLRQEHADEPWKVRPEWRDGRFEAERRRITDKLLLAVVFNLVGWPLAFVVLRSELFGPDPEYAALLVLLFPLLGTLLGWLVAREILHHRKFGRTVMELDPMPVPLGGRLRGRVETGIRARDAPSQGFHVSLSCYRRRVVRSTDSDGGSKRKVELDLLWRDEKRMEGVPFDAGLRLSVPLSFDVPRDEPESTPERTENRILWLVGIHADLPGLDYEANLEVPVFDLGEAAGRHDVQSERSLRPQPPGGSPGIDDYDRLELRDRFSEPRSPGIELRRPSFDGIEFFFDRARNKGDLLILVLVSLTCAGLAVGLGFFHDDGGLFIFLFLSVFVAAFGYVAYREWSHTVTLTVDEDRVSFVKGPFGEGEPTVLPVSGLVDVRAEVDKSRGSGSRGRTYYQLTLVRRASAEEQATQADELERWASRFERMGLKDDDGKPVSDHLSGAEASPTRDLRVVGGLTDKQEADWIAARVKEVAFKGRSAD